MVKLIVPTDVKLTYRPLVLTRSDDELDRLSRMEWRLEVIKARTIVGRALNQFYYGGR